MITWYTLNFISKGLLIHKEVKINDKIKRRLGVIMIVYYNDFELENAVMTMTPKRRSILSLIVTFLCITLSFGLDI